MCDTGPEIGSWRHRILTRAHMKWHTLMHARHQLPMQSVAKVISGTTLKFMEYVYLHNYVCVPNRGERSRVILLLYLRLCES